MTHTLTGYGKWANNVTHQWPIFTICYITSHRLTNTCML